MLSFEARVFLFAAHHVIYARREAAEGLQIKKQGLQMTTLPKKEALLLLLLFKRGDWPNVPLYAKNTTIPKDESDFKFLNGSVTRNVSTAHALKSV